MGGKTRLCRFASSSSGFMEKYFGPESSIASPDFKNRWSMFVPAFATHVCLGSPYGWSAISGTINKELGFVAPASADWSLDMCTYPMSIMIAFGGIAAAVFGKWTMKVGTRKALFCGGSLLGTAFLLSGIGVAQHSLPLLYMGNLLAGIGYGCAYTPPIQALLEWFPDKKGTASGIVIAGFGSGALFFTPMMNHFIQTFSKLPTYLGNSVETVMESGKIFAKVGDELKEVVYATSADLAKLSFSGLSEGFYVVGSGSTGAAEGLMCMGLIYGLTVMGSSLIIRRPAPGYIPEGYDPSTAGGTSSDLNVHVNDLLKTPQFWLLFSSSTLLCTGGMGLMSVAKPMINDVFATSMPAIVTTSFASSYLMAMAAGNLGGRLGWAAISDKIGCRNTFNIFTLSSVPIFATLPFFINEVVTNPTSSIAPVYLGVFCAATVASISVMGGTFAVLPAYEAGLYGSKYVQAIHGRFLLAATTSTIVGPYLLLTLRKMAESSAIQELLEKVDPIKFAEHFGTNIAQSQTLIEAKTLTISKLMTIMPAGTVDPSPFIYNNTMYTMAGLVGTGAVLHFMVKPVEKKFFKKD
nr:LOW QUALITY PROTEIN: oxalate:formate antiporter-like [Lepeophtheirus salmonis]